jgi:hypothetical protein
MAEERYQYGELKQEDLEKRTIRAKREVMVRLESLKGNLSWTKFVEVIVTNLEKTRHHI